MKRIIGLFIAVLLVVMMCVTPVAASEEDAVTVGATICEDDHDYVDGVCAMCGAQQPRTAGPLGYVIIIVAALGLSLLRPFMMSRRLRKNYYDERAWGLDKHRKF